MTTTKQYDFLNRLTSISSSSSSSFAYDYNSANQRTRVTLADGSYWRYTYDPLGQVTSGKKFWSDQTPVAGQQFCYTFDDIGNRTQTQAGGDQNGGYLRTANYYANLLNQYTNRDVPGFVDVMGLAYATNAVTVNGQTAYRKGEYFRDQYAVNNSSSAVWTNMTIAETGCTPVSGNMFVPQTQEQFSYDADGNLTRDGRWNYGWDAENRLVALTNRVAAAPAQVLRFEYDPKGRRVRKQVWSNSDGSGTPATDLKFAYDGWNLLAALNSSSALLQSFLWGLDLSGSAQGAGGIGGLLEVNCFGTQTTNTFAAFDGNGNLAALMNTANGTLLAQYEYSPFGELIRVTGPMAQANPFRFSTKRQDDETDLYYYGYRYYIGSTGRWLIRDAIEEAGGPNVYGFVGNDALCSIDYLGFAPPSAVVEKSIVSIFARYGAYKTVETTGYLYTMARYRNLLPRTKIVAEVFPEIAKYDPATRTLIIDKYVDVIAPHTLSHELAHVYDDLVLGWGDNKHLEMDEAMGYAMGDFAQIAERLYGVEFALKTKPCDEAEALAGQRWKGLWSTFGSIPSTGWGPVIWDDKNRRDMVVDDLKRLSNFHKVQLGCKAAAEELNKIAEGKDCCFRFSCEPNDDENIIGTGVKINDFFR